MMNNSVAKKKSKKKKKSNAWGYMLLSYTPNNDTCIITPKDKRACMFCRHFSRTGLRIGICELKGKSKLTIKWCNQFKPIE